MQPNTNTNQPLLKIVQQSQITQNLSVRSTAQPSAASSSHLPGTTLPVIPEADTQIVLIIQEALEMNLPHHLVLQRVCRRFRRYGSHYTDIKDLVADVFQPSSVRDQEVAMETDQLEDAVMMNSPVVKEALRNGVPPELIKPKLRAKILSTGEGYADISELLTDV